MDSKNIKKEADKEIKPASIIIFTLFMNKILL